MRLSDLTNKQKPVDEAAYEGNIGMMEMFKFYKVATPKEKKYMQELLSSKNFKTAWEFLKRITGVDLKEVKIDNDNGMGAVPNNAEVDYHGLRVLMRPTMFLSLATDMPENPEDIESVKGIAAKMRQGVGIGAPWLDIIIPKEWEDGDFKQPAKVRNHEGRHRMNAIIAEEGNAPVEVHIFCPGFRRRHLTPEIIKHLNGGAMKEKSTQFIHGPLFTM